MNIAHMIVSFLLVLYLSNLHLFAQNNKEYFKSQMPQGELTAPELREVSGIIPAHTKGMFWAHNDSGDGPNVYLLDAQAKLVKTFTLAETEVVDCEDIDRVTIGGKSHLVLADIGNNLQKRTWITLYIFPEPSLKDSALIPRSSIRTVHVKFPGRKRLDAEAIMVDPTDNMLYVVSKREFRSTVYSAPVFKNPRLHYYTLDKIVELPFTFATAAAIDPRGREMLIKNITHIFYWKRNPKIPWSAALREAPIQIPYVVEPQGEAIAFDNQGNGFYTISERPFGLKSYLYYFEKIQ